MRAKPPDSRGIRWVRLIDVPQHDRVRAAHQWIRSHPHEPPEDGVALMLVALEPGPRAGGWVKA